MYSCVSFRLKESLDPRYITASYVVKPDLYGPLMTVFTLVAIFTANLKLSGKGVVCICDNVHGYVCVHDCRCVRSPSPSPIGGRYDTGCGVGYILHIFYYYGWYDVAHFIPRRYTRDYSADCVHYCT